MNKSKTYILKKDLPDAKAGSEYVLSENGFLYGKLSGGSSYHNEVVENSPEWFEEKKPLLKQYTIDDMRLCFNESRLTNPMIGFIHDTFEEFIKNIPT